MKKKATLWGRLKTYKLTNNVYVLIFLAVTTVAALWVYIDPAFHSSDIVKDIALAFATSLLASIFCLFTDIYVKYKDLKSDEFLDDIKSFGIYSLHFNKQKLLAERLAAADKEIWVSGYRLIITSNLSKEIGAALQRGARLRVLASPPWGTGFQNVYGGESKVMDNYYKVFKTALDSAAHIKSSCEVRFTNKALFSDTYKVDGHLLSGPYLHNKDPEYGRITANDFFTYDIANKSPLYNLVETEYTTVWNEAQQQLDWDKFKTAYDRYYKEDLNESEKRDLFVSCCTDIGTEPTELQ